MEVFCHHLYEYKKGIRNLVLHTIGFADSQKAIKRLEQNGIHYVAYRITPQKVNLFFGARECVDIVKAIGKKNLKHYTPEEDFMLGIMLGYERRKQCERYLRMVAKQNTHRNVSTQ